MKGKRKPIPDTRTNEERLSDIVDLYTEWMQGVITEREFERYIKKEVRMAWLTHARKEG